MPLGRVTQSCVAALAVALALGVPTTAAAQDDAAPTLLSPADGASVVAGSSLSFRIQTFPGETHSLWLHVSRSPATGADGLIASDVEIEPFSPTSQAGLFEAVPTFFDYEGFWMNTPGTYYWQAHRIHCTSGSADCRVESPVRTLVLTPRPTSARIAIGPPRACHRAGDRVHVTGTGFAANAAVELLADSSRIGSATADAQGDVETEVAVPSPGSGPRQHRYRLTARERNFPANAATATLQATTLAFDVRPASFVRRGQRVRFSFAGFPSGRGIYAHYRLGSRTLASVRLGLARGACGTLVTRAPMIPTSVLRAGSWSVQFDARSAYSPRATPRLRTRIRVRTIRVG